MRNSTYVTPIRASFAVGAAMNNALKRQHRAGLDCRRRERPGIYQCPRRAQRDHRRRLLELDNMRG